MKLEVLVSTMNKKDISFLNRMNITKNCLIINQTKKNYEENFDNDIRMISVNEVGLSKSRNKAIENSKAEICVLADDDLVYVDNFDEIIENSFNENQDIDILCFCVEGINKKFKNYHKLEKRLNFITSMKVSSVEIAFKRKSIINNNIRFDEKFGSGSKEYKMGEENIFLAQCLKKGLKIKFIPIKIANLYIGESTWFNGYNEKYFFDRGAVFSALNKNIDVFLILQFAIRKYGIYKEEISFLKAMKQMIKGRNHYRKEG